MAGVSADDQGGSTGARAVARAFGAENRARLLERYFAEAEPVDVRTAWKHVYRLLLWIDRTTALAHCYESDKAQPGRPWYARSLAFHAWVAAALGVPPARLAEEIDWLFRGAVQDLASRSAGAGSPEYEIQREPYAGQDFPEPGEDPELVALIKESLQPWLGAEPPDEEMRRLTRRIHAYLTQENKRKNLVGEGFEDVLAAILRRLPLRPGTQVLTRTLLQDLPGFNSPSRAEKAKKVDLALLDGTRRTLVSAKWSIRADREEQFDSDFQAYSRLEAAGEDFDYVLVTNEFDAARLKAACERRRQNAFLFSHVVHISPAAVLEVYASGGGASAGAVRQHVEAGRLQSLEAWLARMVPGATT